MKLTFDTDTIIFQTLNADSALKAALFGGIYVRQRPDNSTSEDIAINTIALSQEYLPQIGTSNINIHVVDKTISIGGKQQKVADLSRLKLLSELVMTKVRGIVITGLKMIVENQTVIQDSEIGQHYVNIRINWNIHE